MSSIVVAQGEAELRSGGSMWRRYLRGRWVPLVSLMVTVVLW